MKARPSVDVPALASGGIRLDVQPEKAPQDAVQDLLGLDPFSQAGLVVREPGMVPLHLMQAVVGTAYPPAFNVLYATVGGDDVLCGTGRINVGAQYHLGFWWNDRPGTDGETWELAYLAGTAVHPGTIGQPLRVADQVVAPLGPLALPMLFQRGDFFGAPCVRPAKLGYPEISCDDADSMWVPFLYVDTHNNDGHQFTEGMNSGAVGYTEGAALENMSFVNYDGANYWYAYSGIDQIVPDGGPRGLGWGYESGAGNGSLRWVLKEMAVGYVYVYSDGTLSEPVVYRWHNNPGGGTVYSPFNMRWSREANICIVGFRGQIQLPKNVVDRERAIKGVRVFYCHNSSSREDDRIDAGYRGWAEERDILQNMREAWYVEEADRNLGYCALSGASSTTHDPQGSGVEIPVYRFGYFVCPCELSVSQPVSYLGDDQPYYVRDPMTLGAKWSEIRGDLADGNGVIVSFPTGQEAGQSTALTATLYERGRVVRTWGHRADHGPLFFEDDTAGDIRARADVYASAMRTGAVVNSLVVASGMRWTHSDEEDRRSVYVSHVAPDGTPYPYSFPTSRRVPINRGNVVAVARCGDEAVIGTDETVYVMSFGDGTPETWSVRDLNVPSGCAGPRAMLGIGYSAYFVDGNGHVRRYDMGAIEAADLGRQVAGPSTIIPAFARASLDSGAQNVALAYDPARETVYASWMTGIANSLTLMVHVPTGRIARSNKKFVSGCVGHDGRMYLSTGNSVYYVDPGVEYVYDPPASVPSDPYRYSGIVNQANDDVSVDSVTDTGLDESTTDWGDGKDPPQAAGAMVSVAYVDAGLSGYANPILSRNNSVRCFTVNGAVAITGYADDDPVAGYGKVSTSDDLFDDTSSAMKDGCGGAPNAWRTYGPDDGTENVDSQAAIGFALAKEIPLSSQWRYARFDALHLVADIESGSDQSIAVAATDPSGFWGGKSFTLASGSVLHSRGRIELVFRALVSRLKIALTGTLGGGKSFRLRYLSLKVRNGGRDASS